MDEPKTYYYARAERGDAATKEFLALGAKQDEIVIGALPGLEGYLALKESRLKPGDTLVIYSLHDLGEQKKDMKKELLYFKGHRIRVKVLELPSTMKDYGTGQEWIANMISDIVIASLANLSD